MTNYKRVLKSISSKFWNLIVSHPTQIYGVGKPSAEEVKPAYDLYRWLSSEISP